MKVSIVLILVIFILVIILTTGCIQNEKESYTEKAAIFDKNYIEQYETLIKPEGAKKINAILFEVDKIDNPQEKLNAIAKWETKNFTSSYWGHTYVPIDDLGRYYLYDNGKVRAYTCSTIGIDALYRYDPYWIAYQMAGECEEKAVLFEEVASRAGFITRRVIGPSHSWVEVKNMNDKGNWWYFDIDCYHNNIDSPTKWDNQKWYNQTKYFHLNCGSNTTNVIVEKTHENISNAYRLL